MNLKYYDVLSNLICGSLVLFVMVFSYTEDNFQNIVFHNELIFIVLSFTVGYVVNAVSSLVECLLYFSWGGKPSIKLVEQNYCEIQSCFLERHPNKQLPSNQMFNMIHNEVVNDSHINNRIEDFNGSYALSRSLCIAYIIIFLPLTNYIYNDVVMSCKLQVGCFLGLLILFLLLWYRSKQKAYYFAKEVINAYIFKRT